MDLEGQENEYSAFLSITSVWGSYVDEKSRILIGKLTHLEIKRVCFGASSSVLRLQLPGENILACIFYWAAKNNDFRWETKNFSQKTVFKVKGTIWGRNERSADRGEGLREAELTGGLMVSRPLVRISSPYPYCSPFSFSKMKTQRKTVIREAIRKDNVQKFSI